VRRRAVAVLAAAASVVALAAATPAASAAPSSTPLTNLAHLDFLTASVTPPAQAGHTTYRLGQDPSVGVLWVYATRNDDGSFTRVGGGDHDPTTDTYGQGAYDADDMARAAVVYLRHWRRFGDAHSHDEAIALLRGLTYLQDASGPHAGEVVLWMQPDGTLQPSATPADTPDPSDSADSYWLARTLWALGEGYADLRASDHGFAQFLRSRLDLGLGALGRDSLSRYGRHLVADGVRTPAWLMTDGADASAEAVLGLAAATRAGTAWPYGAVLPSATSRSTWHAWASLTPAALADASAALRRPGLADGAVADSASFDPTLLTSYGPVNGLTPAPTDRSQIAYGVDSRVESLLATAQVTGASGLRALAGVTAGWFFGANPSGQPTYDPATGVTDDGVAADGTVNRNSGAESTIHGLLTMLALDANPDVARLARSAGGLPHRVGTTVVEGEAATVTGAAAPVTADPASTAESAWSGGAYLDVTGPATATWSVAAAGQGRVLEAVVDRRPGRGGTATFAGAGPVSFGGAGAQGASAVPGELAIVPVGRVAAGATSVTARLTGPGRLDALLLTPVVASVRSGSVTLLDSRTGGRTPTRSPGAGVARGYDSRGRLVATDRVRAGDPVGIPAGGFVVVSLA
jgi:hypothetical protein